jgi:peptide/nickel transport system substrate-binding protein
MTTGRAVLRRALILLLILGLVATACGGSDDTDGGASEREREADADAEPSETDNDARDIDPEGIVRVGYDLVSAAKGGFTWDPAEIKTQLTDDAVLYLVYGRLLRRTADGDLVPDLAERTEVIDETTVEIVVRDGVTFHDGVPFDAEVVKAGLERNLALTDSPGPGPAFFDAETVEVTGPNTLRVTIPSGSAASWHDSFLGSWETTIVREDTDFGMPVGAGPMRLARHVPEQSIVLERYDDYWDAESILVAGVELVHVPGDAAQSAAAAVQTGQVDIATTDTRLMQGFRPPLEAIVTPDPNQLATFQTCKRDGPLAEIDVRRALNKAIDREAIIAAVFDGTAEPATSLWPAGHRFQNADVADELAYDPEGARELLEQTGYADGFEFDLYVIQAGALPETAEVLQQQFAEVGVRMNIIPSSNYVEEFLVAQRSGAGLVPTMSPNRLKVLQWSGERIGNACTYHDPELEALKEDLEGFSDASDEAVELWHRIEAKAVDEALSIFLFFGARLAVYNTDRLGDATLWPDVITMPDVRKTYVRTRR